MALVLLDQASCRGCIIDLTRPVNSAYATTRQESGQLVWRFEQLDPLGFILIAPAVISLLFALEWGGSRYA